MVLGQSVAKAKIKEYLFDEGIEENIDIANRQNSNYKGISKGEKEKLEKEKELQEKIKQIKINEAMKEILEIEQSSPFNKTDDKSRGKSLNLTHNKRSNSLIHLRGEDSFNPMTFRNSQNQSKRNKSINKISDARNI